MYTFGCNDEGALGRATAEDDDCMEPGKVDIPEKIKQVSAGDSHTAALSGSGQVYMWGTFRVLFTFVVSLVIYSKYDFCCEEI